jgi:hypothetical protein
LDEDKSALVLDDRTGIDAIAASHATPIAHDLLFGQEAMILVDPY